MQKGKTGLCFPCNGRLITCWDLRCLARKRDNNKSTEKLDNSVDSDIWGIWLRSLNGKSCLTTAARECRLAISHGCPKDQSWVLSSTLLCLVNFTSYCIEWWMIQELVRSIYLHSVVSKMIDSSSILWTFIMRSMHLSEAAWKVAGTSWPILDKFGNGRLHEPIRCLINKSANLFRKGRNI